MKTRLLLLGLMLISLTTLSQNAAVENIAQKLQDYYQFYPIEKIQLTTDKEIYKPEEIIWFSMLITNATGQAIEPYSSECLVELYFSDGELVASDVYRTHTGLMKGDLMIPGDLQEGKYVLVASTPMLSSADEAFYKRIDINPKNENAFKLQQTAVPAFLLPGSANNYAFSLTTMNGDPAKKEKLQAELFHGTELIEKQKLRTDSEGATTMELTLPEQDYNNPLKLVISTKKNELNYTTILPVKDAPLVVYFYPEGGHLVAGTQKLGFTIHNQLGQPVSASAEIRDEQGNKLAQTVTSMPGFGIIPASFEKGKLYSLHISSELGENQSFPLPQVEEALSLSIIRTDEEFIYTNLVPATQDAKTIYLTANKGEAIFWATELKPESPMRLKIPKTNFPNGISQLTVFNEQQQILANRLVYTEKKTVHSLQLAAPKQVKAGEVFKFSLETDHLEEPVPEISLCISAAEENKNWASQWVPWLLLNSDLEETLPDADKLLQSSSLETTMNYLLIANRMKNHHWINILHFDHEREQNKYQQPGVFGKVIDQNNEPVPNAKVSFIHAQNMQIIHASTDEYGTFFQQAIVNKDLDNFAIKAIGPDGNENLKVKFEKSLAEQVAEQVRHFIQTKASAEQASFSKDFYQQNKDLFTPLKRAEDNLPKSEPSYKQYLMTGTSVLEVLKTIKPFRLSGDKIIFPGGTNSINAQDGALIVVDGQKLGTSASVLNSLSPLDIESINVSTSPVDIQRYTGLNSVGLIEIRTKRGEALEEISPQETENLYENGYRIPRDFWLKKSENPEQQPTTLFWNPSVKLNPLGRSEFEVNANQVAGEFILRVDVVDSQGRISTQSQTIEVIP
ncbi:hypothetical protein [Sunxiuqinia sp. sy24]|uniref:hypothetical protein n=1 Tax=Sunxiuqinia sp. sy24 TaxID=3461495 RepID=UPI004045FDBF